MHEGVQYYHRYRSAFHLKRFDLVARDTARNLRLFAFVARYAARQDDKLEFERYRPYVEMMHARALASQALVQGKYKRALGLIDEGVKAIRRFLLDYQQEEEEANCPELHALLSWRREVERERPGDHWNSWNINSNGLSKRRTMRKQRASVIRSAGSSNGNCSSSHGVDWAGPSRSLRDF